MKLQLIMPPFFYFSLPFFLNKVNKRERGLMGPRAKHTTVTAWDEFHSLAAQPGLCSHQGLSGTLSPMLTLVKLKVCRWMLEARMAGATVSTSTFSMYWPMKGQACCTIYATEYSNMNWCSRFEHPKNQESLLYLFVESQYSWWAKDFSCRAVGSDEIE